MSASAQTIKLGAVTLRIDRACLDGMPTIVTELECEHSTTKAIVIEGGQHWNEGEVVKAVCRRALAETPCSCVETVLAQYAEGF